jgi:hypothetical protein
MYIYLAKFYEIQELADFILNLLEDIRLKISISYFGFFYHSLLEIVKECQYPEAQR